MTFIMNFDELRAAADGRQQDATARCNIWAAKFAKDPLYAMEWSESAFSAAADRYVWATVLSFIDHAIENKTSEKDFAVDLIKFARERQMDVVRQPPRSTSAQSNIAKQDVARSWYEVVDGGFSSVAATLNEWAK